MFRTFARKFLPNPLDRMLKKTNARGGKKILLVWNRGLGDIALGLFAIVHRIREMIQSPEITFVTRQDLLDGFSLLENIRVLVDPSMQRGSTYSVKEFLTKIEKSLEDFDLVIENPSPSDWVTWQRGQLTPKLKFEKEHFNLHEKFSLESGFTYIAVQPVIETTYGVWRNWPLDRWLDLLDRLEKYPHVKVVLVGSQNLGDFPQKNIIDLRGKTSLFELLSLIIHRFDAMILQDSGILSMAYYLDVNFPLKVISLWADPFHGILKQNVASPNPSLVHMPVKALDKDLSNLSVDTVMDCLFPKKALSSCPSMHSLEIPEISHTCLVVLAGGQGSRLGVSGPKGIFPLYDRSLFGWICHKTPEKMPIVVMTNFDTHDEIVDFFLKNQMFHREVYFFTQDTLPFLDENKKALKIMAPSGNGSFYRSFFQSSAFQLLQKRGIRFAHIINVDNPMAIDTASKLEGFLLKSSADVAVCCMEKLDRKMGVLMDREGFVEIVEYIYLNQTEEEKYGYTGAMTASFDFIEKVAFKNLPVHLVAKKIPKTQKMGFKQETFIFDAFVYGKALAVQVDPSIHYFPVKDMSSAFPSKSLLEMV